MKVVDIKCPGCGAELHISGDRTECFCEYCGSKILLDDEAVKNVTVIRDEAKLRELQLEEERIKEAKEKLEEYKRLNEELRSKRKTRDIVLISVWIGALVLFFIFEKLVPKNGITSAISAFSGMFHLAMGFFCLEYFAFRKSYSGRIAEQEKLIKELEYNRILNNKQNKN